MEPEQLGLVEEEDGHGDDDNEYDDGDGDGDVEDGVRTEYLQWW